MSKLGPHFLCTGHRSLFVKAGALAAGTFWFHCMKIFIFTIRGSYHSDSVSLQAHIFWISEKQAALSYTGSCYWENIELVSTGEKNKKLAATELGWL